MKEQSSKTLGAAEIAIGVFSIVGLYIVSRYSYPVFHTLAELFSIVIGFGLFMMIWNARRIIDNDYLLFIGIAYFFVAAFDLVHTLAFKGVAVFPGYGTNTPTQLWVAARYIESISLLAAPLFISRKLRTYWTFAGFAMLTSIVLISIFLQFFPDCYIEGFGLTRFKVVSEYIISAILACSLILLLKKRANFDREILALIMLSIIATIGSELAFTSYVGVYDFSNLIGHVLKIIAFYLIYKAVIEAGLSKPYNLLFRNLKRQEETLREREEWLRVTLSSIGDAVIATDTAGNITFMNAVAEELTGWALADAATKPVPEIFNIISEKTRREVENPITKALREGTIVGLANHTILIRKDGTEVPIDDSAAPIRNRDGKTVGVVLVFRDITERKRGEEVLRENREQLSAVFNGVSETLMLLDVDGNILAANKLAAQRFNKGKTDFVGKNLYDSIPVQFHERRKEQILEMVRTKKPVKFQDRFEDTFLEITFYPVIDVFGDVRQFVSFALDITERKRAEEAVQTALQRFYTVLSSMYSGLLLVTDEGWVEFANQAICDYFDLNDSPQDLVGLTESEILPKIRKAYLHPDEAFARIKEIVDRGQPVRDEEVPMVGGRELLRDFIPLRINGKSYGRLWYHTDITERKKAQEALRQSEQSLRALAENVPDQIVRFDRNLRLLYANPAALRRIGLPEEMLMGRTASEYGAAPTAAVRWDQVAREVLESGEPQRYEHASRWEGETRILDAQIVPERNTDGTVQAVIGIARDITERKRAEEALQKANTELEQRVQERTFELSEAYETLQREVDEHKKTAEHLIRAQKLEALGTLAGGIAHDFNNILAGIIGFTEMVLEDINPDGPEYKRLGLALKGANRGRELVRQILTFSRQTAPDRKPLALGQVVEEGLKLLRPTLPSTIEIVSKSVTNDDIVLADPVQMHQILMNLCTNAAHAMRDKGGRLDISISKAGFAGGNPAPFPEMTPGEYVMLEVRDTGCGIEPEVLERIFDPFFTTKQQGEGTGLGLSVAHGIIKSHGGYVTVESKPGKGTVFQIYLPTVKGQKLSKDEAALAETGGKECILIVDDEDILIELNKQRLSKLGYDVVATTSSTEALEYFRKEPDRFDLVITDHTMPNLTGMDLAAELLKIRATIPIILCTGHSETVSPEQAKESGIRAFLMKPLAKQELATAIRRVLNTKMEK